MNSGDAYFDEVAAGVLKRYRVALERLASGVMPSESDIGPALDAINSEFRSLRARLGVAEGERDKYRNGLISARGLVDSVWNGRVGGMFAYDVIDDALGDGEGRDGDDLRTALAEVAGVIESFHARDPHLKLAYALSVARAALGEG